MRRHAHLALLLCVGLTVGLCRDHTMGRPGPGTPIGPDVRRAPNAATMQQIRHRCSAPGGEQFGECSVQGMRQSGASPQALALTRHLGNPGYVREFRAAGRVDIAHVAYPFRANENHGWRLVNGEPPLVTDATQPIRVISSQDFTLALESNRTTGYRWQLARPLDEAVVKFIRSQYRDVATGRLGAGGEELWTFQAVGPGQAQITMQYVRPWERQAAPVKQMTFVVVVHQ